MDSRKLLSSEYHVSTTADGEEVLRIRLSIVVYHVDRRLIESATEEKRGYKDTPLSPSTLYISKAVVK